MALAVALGADICEIYTDVDGIFTRRPAYRAFRPPHSVHRLRVHSGDGVLRLQGAGTCAVVEYAQRFNMPLHVRSSFSRRPAHWWCPTALTRVRCRTSTERGYSER